MTTAVEELIARMVENGGLSLALRVSRAAGLLDLGRSAIYDAIHKGAIKTITINGQLRIPLSELLRVIGEQRAEPTTELQQGGGAGAHERGINGVERLPNS